MERGGGAPPDCEPAETATQGDKTLRLMFAVKHQHVAQLEQILWDVSDSEPTSPSYGHFWSLEQINSLVAPTKETVQELQHWLHSCTLSVHPASKAPLLFRATSPGAELEPRVYFGCVSCRIASSLPNGVVSRHFRAQYANVAML